MVDKPVTWEVLLPVLHTVVTVAQALKCRFRRRRGSSGVSFTNKWYDTHATW